MVDAEEKFYPVSWTVDQLACNFIISYAIYTKKKRERNGVKFLEIYEHQSEQSSEEILLYSVRRRIEF